MKTSNMKRVIQMTLKHNPADHFDAESRIAGMSACPGFITAFSVASKAGSEEVDQIVSYFEDSHPDAPLVPGQRYAWIMEPEKFGDDSNQNDLKVIGHAILNAKVIS